MFSKDCEALQLLSAFLLPKTLGHPRLAPLPGRAWRAGSQHPMSLTHTLDATIPLCCPGGTCAQATRLPGGRTHPQDCRPPTYPTWTLGALSNVTAFPSPTLLPHRPRPGPQATGASKGGQSSPTEHSLLLPPSLPRLPRTHCCPPQPRLCTHTQNLTSHLCPTSHSA